MTRQVFDFDPPERFVAGTVGAPGQRTFFLQARAGRRITSVALEKQQVSVLAERIEELLDEVLRRSGGAVSVPALAPADTRDDAPLDAPIEEEFRVAAMSLAWDGESERVVIECYDRVPELAEAEQDDDEAEAEDGAEPEDVLALEETPELDDALELDDAIDEDPPDAEDDGGDILRVTLTGAAARAFAKRALAVVGAGRPPCPFCDNPLDPQGHVCPRANGYRR